MHTENHFNPSIDNMSAPLARQPVFSGGYLVPYFVSRANPNVSMKWIWTPVFLCLARAPHKATKGPPDTPKTPVQYTVDSSHFVVHSSQITVPRSHRARLVIAAESEQQAFDYITKKHASA